MADTLRIKRRATGAPGAPSTLANAELAFNEVDHTLWYGAGGSAGAAANIIPVAGPGAFLPLVGGTLSGKLWINGGVDALELTDPNYARIRHTRTGQRTWSAGVYSDNAYKIGDETSSIFRLSIDTAGNISTLGTLILQADPTTALGAVTMQYSDRNKITGYADITSNAATLNVDQSNYGNFYIYGTPTAPATLTMAAVGGSRLIWNVNNATTQPITVKLSGSAGTVTLPSFGSADLLTDTANVQLANTVGYTRAPGDSTTFLATTAFVTGAMGALGNYLPIAGGTMNGVLYTNSGINFNNAVSGGAQDMSRGITLYGAPTGGGYGFVVTGNTLNYNTLAGWHDFYSSTTLLARIGNGQLTSWLPLSVQNNISASGTLTITGASTFAGAATFNNLVSVNSNLTVGTSTQSSTRVNIWGAKTTTAGIGLFTLGQRWNISLDHWDETGSPANAGSNLAFYTFDDSGNFLGTPLSIDRNTGHVWLSESMTVSRDPTANLEVATRQYVGAKAGTGPSTITPLIDSGASIGSDTGWSRGDHVHPTVTQINQINISSGSRALTVNEIAVYGLYLYGATGPTTLTLPVTTTPAKVWQAMNIGNYPITLQGTGGGTITLPAHGSQAVWTDTGGIYPMNTVTGTPAPADNSQTVANTAFVYSAFLPLAGGTVVGATTFSATGVGAQSSPVVIQTAMGAYTPTVPASKVNWSILELAMNGANLSVTLDAYGGSPFVNGRTAEGAFPSNSPSIVDRVLFGMRGYGWSAAGFSSAERARIHFAAAEPFTDTAQGAYISFLTTPIGSVSVASEVARLSNAGATFSVPVALPADPTTALGAVTKQYVDNHAPLGGPYLPISGGTVTGTITAQGAATFNAGIYFQGAGLGYQTGMIYTDSNFGCLIRGHAGAIYDVALADNGGSWWVGLASGGLLTVIGAAQFQSTVALAADPTTGLQAATKQYVDNHAPLGGPYLPLAGGNVTGYTTFAPSMAVNNAGTNTTLAPGLGGGSYNPLLHTGDGALIAHAGAVDTGVLTLMTWSNSALGIRIDGVAKTIVLTANNGITVSADPTASMGIATKQYVDNHAPLGGPYLPLAGGTISGGLSFGSATSPSGNAGDASRHIMLWGSGTNTTYGISVTGARLNLLVDSGGSHYFVRAGNDIAAFGSGGLQMFTGAVTLASDPSLAMHAATKNYVDAHAAGLVAKAAAMCATTGANITLSGLQVIDGYTTLAGDRVLVKDQTTQANNGIYVAATTAWARALDMDTWAEVPQAYVFVSNGTVNANSSWTCNSATGGTIGTTAITWVQFSQQATVTAGPGLTRVGNQFSVVGTANRILVGGAVDIASTYVGQSSITTLGVITSGTWTGSDITVPNGGTGVSTLTAGYVKASGVNPFTSVASIPNTDITGLGTMATQAASAVTITGGTINAASVGATTPSTGAFTNLSATGAVSGAGFTNLLAPYATTGSVPVGSSSLPIMDGTATIGVGATWARADHIHPTDTSRLSTGGGTLTGQLIAPYMMVNSSGANGAQGFYTMWNRVGGSGAAYLVNNRGLGGGGFILIDTNTSGADVTLLTMNTGAATFSVPVALPANATTNLQAVPLQQLNSAVAASVTSWNTRTGAVTLSNADVIAVLPGSSTLPIMDGTATIGTGTTWAHADHIHPTDTSRLSTGGGTVSGPLTVNSTLSVSNTATFTSQVRVTNNLGISYDNNNFFKFIWTGSGPDLYVDNSRQGTIALQPWVSGNYLALVGGSLSGGLHFGGAIAPGGPTDTSRHITLYDNGYGFSVTGGTLNTVAGGALDYYPNGGLVMRLNGGGLQMLAGAVTLLADPTSAYQAATKQYVDALIAEPVNVKWPAYGARGNGSTDDTTAIQNALNTGLDVYLPGGTYIISHQLNMTTYGQRVLGAGRSRTFIKVNGPSAANFPTGIIYVNNAAMTGGGDFNVAFADFTMWCVQPDTSVRANLNNYPPMIMLDHAARSQMTNVRLVGGMIGLHMEGNNGGFRAYGCDFGCFYININIDGNLDVTSFVDCEVWCFSATGIMTVNQQKVFWDANCYGIYSKRNDYFDWKGGLLMVGRSAQFDMGTRSDWPGPTYGHFTGCGFDSFGGLGVSAGSILTDNCTFSVGGDPNGIRSGNAVVHTGGVVTIRGGKFFVGAVNLIPAQALIWTGCGSGVASIIIENCEFEMGAADVRAIYAETSNNAYDSIQIANNKFSRLAGYSYANAAVQINGGGGTLTGNVCGPGAGSMTGTVPALGMAAGIGTWLTANNNWHGWLTSVTGSSVTAQNLLQLPPVVGDAMAITQVNGNATIGGMTILGEIGASAAFAGIFVTLLFTGTCTVNSGSYAVAGQFLLNNGTAFNTRTGSHLSVRLSVTGNWSEVGRCY